VDSSSSTVLQEGRGQVRHGTPAPHLISWIDIVTRMTGSRRRDGARGARTRTDACPGAWRRHDAADGALARFRPAGGAVSAPELRVLAGAALAGGSPLELTSRGSLQVLGLDPRTADDLADALRQLPTIGAPLLDTQGRDIPCSVVASPRGVATDPAARRVADALRPRPDVPGRLLVALDDGSGDVRGQGADVTVVLDPAGTGSALLLDGVDTGLRHPDPAALALAAVDAFLALRGESWRLSELSDGVARVAALVVRRQECGITHAGRQRSAMADIPTADIPTRLGVDEHGVLEVLPRLAEIDARTVGVLVGLLDAGATLRVTPWRTLVLRDLADPEDALEQLDGLVETAPDSRWAGLSGCVGAPRCAKSHTDVRGDLAAAVAAGKAGGQVRAHWIGCHRACGTPGGRVAVIEALPGGGYRTVVRAGRVTR